MLTKAFKLSILKKWWFRYWVHPFEYKAVGKDLFDRTMLWNEFLKQFFDTEIVWNVNAITNEADPFINVKERNGNRMVMAKKYVDTDIYQLPGQYRIYRHDKRIIFEIN